MRTAQVEGIAKWPVEAGPEFVHGGNDLLKVLVHCILLESVAKRTGLERDHKTSGKLRFRICVQRGGETE